jgi:hypothetical protein
LPYAGTAALAAFTLLHKPVETKMVTGAVYLSSVMRKILTYLVFILPAFAGDPWRRPSSEWTEEDARRVLSNSPWAKSIEHSAVTVRWESARPVRLALTRLKQTTGTAADASSYAIAVTGLEMPAIAPSVEASLKATGRKALAAFGLNMREDAIVYLFQRAKDVQRPVVFRFPVGPEIGETVEFEARIGSQTIRQKFCLRGMTYDGKLEL